MFYLSILAALWSCAGCGFARTPISDESRRHPDDLAPREAPHFKRVLIVVLENQYYKDAIGNPYLASLAARGANFTNFHALFHPSYSNYLAMVAGKEYITEFDLQRNLGDLMIGDRLGAAKTPLTWTNYAEDYPGGCFTGSSSGKYARKHVPFLSFTSVQNQHCKGIVRVDANDKNNAFWTDVKNGTLPAYAFYSPNLDNDGHDPKFQPEIGLKCASKWLEGFIEPLLANRELMTDTLIVVTFDESGAGISSSDPNQIYTVFLGDMVNKCVCSKNYNHYNVLRTIEDNFDLKPLADGDGQALPIRRDAKVWAK